MASESHANPVNAANGAADDSDDVVHRATTDLAKQQHATTIITMTLKTAAKVMAMKIDHYVASYNTLLGPMRFRMSCKATSRNVRNRAVEAAAVADL